MTSVLMEVDCSNVKCCRLGNKSLFITGMFNHKVTQPVTVVLSTSFSQEAARVVGVTSNRWRKSQKPVMV
jgi:hypothetical protein